MDTQGGSEAATGSAKVSAVTWVGLFVSLFGMLIIRTAVERFAPNPGPAVVLVRELLYLAVATALLVLVRRGEKRPLASVGIGTSPLWKSALWGLGLFFVCGAAGLVLAKLTGYGGGARAEAFSRLPLGIITLAVTRAGIVEEIFYRGYAMTRLREAGLSPALAFLLPLLIFSLGHYPGGWANLLIAFVLGAILAAQFVWRKDLTANIIGHFLVDFVGNVLPKLAP